MAVSLKQAEAGVEAKEVVRTAMQAPQHLIRAAAAATPLHTLVADTQRALTAASKARPLYMDQAVTSQVAPTVTLLMLLLLVMLP
jgi:hypothetical protein